MSKRRQIILTCILTVAVGGLGFYFLLQREPLHQGKPLSSWLKDLDRWDGDTNAPVVQAVVAMGVKAAPFLARATLTKDSALKRKIMAELEQHLELHLTTDSERSKRAGTALSIMGEPARAAAPIFLAALKSDDAFLRRKAVNGLALLGPWSEEYLPTLITLEYDSDVSVRMDLIAALGRIGRRPDLCTPVLLRGVENSNSWVRHLAVVALSEFGSETEFTNAVSKTNGSTVYPAADSVQKDPGR